MLDFEEFKVALKTAQKKIKERDREDRELVMYS